MEAQRYPGTTTASSPAPLPTRLRAGGHVWSGNCRPAQGSGEHAPPRASAQLFERRAGQCDAKDGVLSTARSIPRRHLQVRSRRVALQAGPGPGRRLTSAGDGGAEAVSGRAEPDDARYRLRARRGVRLESAHRRRDAVRRRRPVLPLRRVPGPRVRFPNFDFDADVRAGRSPVRTHPHPSGGGPNRRSASATSASKSKLRKSYAGSWNTA